MKIEYYCCSQCDVWKTVEINVGQIIQGPCCPFCHKRMKRLQQSKLKLKFPKSSRKQVIHNAWT